MAETKFRSDMKVDLIDFWGGDARAVQSARTSTLGAAASLPEERAGLIKFLWREKHLVPFEHSGFTFRIEAPIFVTRQLLKHRTTAISEESGRYRELDGVFYVPAADRPLGQTGKTGEYNMVHLGSNVEAYIRDLNMEACDKAWDNYKESLRVGAAKEVARMVLPVNLYSSMYLTVNARNLTHLINLRNEHHAQYEIREVARQMEGFFKAQMPLTYAAWRSDG